MRILHTLLLVAACHLLVPHDALAQSFIAYDDASNYGEWNNYDNEGYGFAVWNLWKNDEDSGGSFLGGNHDGLIDTGGKSFGIWAENGYFNAQRAFASPLIRDMEFLLELSINDISVGERGIDLYDNEWNLLYNLNINNESIGGTGWAHIAPSHITLRVVQLDNHSFQVFLTRQNDSSQWSSEPIQGRVAVFKAYVGDTGGGGERDFFINGMRIIQPGGRLNLADGVRIPGEWNDWSNATGMGGQFDLQRNIIGTWRWQTTFLYGGESGNQDFKFASTGPDGPWNNQWAGSTMQVDEMASLSYSTSGDASDSSISLDDGKWYTVLFEDKGYHDTRAIFMETSAEPVGIVTVTQNPGVVGADDDVDITATLSGAPSLEETFYLRYTTDDWESSEALTMDLNGSDATATIPGKSSGTEVSWYVFSSVFPGLTADFDMRTLRINNNAGNNYTYTVDQQAECAALALATNPAFPLQSGTLTITLNTSLGNVALGDYEGDIYAHTGVITDMSANSSDWRYVKTGWGEDTQETKLTAVPGEDHLYTLTIDDIRAFYGVPAEEDILQLAMIFRSENDGTDAYLIQRNADGSDFLIDIHEPSLNVKLLSPLGRNILLGADRLITVCAAALENTELSIYLNDEPVETVAASEISTLVSFHGLPAGKHIVKAVATDVSKATVEASTSVFIREALPIADLPEPVASIADRKDIPGIHYHDNDQGATLVLHDPPGLKKFAFVIGDFNDWQMTPEHHMNRTPNGQYFWVDITGLEPGIEYAYQYFIDDELRLADPYAEKVLDPWNDHWISDFNYPDLKAYPHGKTTGTASVLHPGRPEYDWQVTDFDRPDVRDLVIYELHIRDFVETDAIKSVEEKLDYLEALGVNAIELMPINQFEGNDSWGYNPSFYFATDKAYGTREDYKRFIDAAHERGMAVILDIVLNHSFNMSPFAQMYFDEDAGEWGQPTPDNPWYLTGCPPNLPWCWGNTFDQDSPYTHELFHRILVYWLEKFNIDGYRFDFTKGFSNVPSGNQGNDFDPVRVANLERIAAQVWDASPGAYVILEHLTGDEEERHLAAEGMLIWGNMDTQYAQAAMGWEENSDLSRGLHTVRDYVFHNLVSYMESHDEQRIMYEMLNYGNQYNTDHNVQDLDIALARAGLAAAFYFVAPGPKMIWQFGELGYDFHINHCPDGTVSEDCRTSRKPIPWSEELDYSNHPERRQLFDVYSRLIRLKTSQPVFRTGNINHDLGGYLKRLHLNENMDGSGQKVTLLGNFDVVARDITPYFQGTGTWYEYFTGDVLEVTDTEQVINLQPGEYRLYYEEPFHPRYYSSTTGNLDDLSNWGNNVDGTGSQPTNFTEDWTYYYVRNNTDAVINNPLTISGDNSRLIVGDRNTSINLTMAADVEAGIIEVTPAATLTVASGQHLTVNERLLNRGSIVLEPGAMLTVEGNISNVSGAEALVLKASDVAKGDTPAYASLIHDTPGVQATAERLVVIGDGAWNPLSSPVVDQRFDYGFDDGNLFAWFEPVQSWVSHGDNTHYPTWNHFMDDPETEEHEAFLSGLGYFHLPPFDPGKSGEIRTFSGTLQLGDFTFALSRSAHSEDPHPGFNLLGNPFPSAIDWHEADLSLFEDNYAYLYDLFREGGPGYVNIDGLQAGAYIPPMHSFFVQAKESADFVFTREMRSHMTEAPGRDRSPGDLLVLRLADGAYHDESRIRIREGSAFERDRSDALKLFSYADYVPQLYSLTADNVRVAVNSIPWLDTDGEIILGMRIPEDGEYSLSVQELGGSFLDHPLLLVDDLEGIVHDLRASSAYEFQSLAGNDDGRFRLRFGSMDDDDSVGIAHAGTEPEVRIWYHGRTLHVDNPGLPIQLHLYDATGRRLRHFDVPAGQHQFGLNLPAGLYFVNTPGGRDHTTLKIVIK